MAHPDIEALFAAAIAQAKIPLPAEGKWRLIIKSEEAKKSFTRRQSK